MDRSTPAQESQAVDLLVVGGGINGAGIARDAAGRGWSVVLCDQADLAQGTSSRSSRLIHGGLRYLEYGEWRLVREALQERETLLAIAPHLVRPQPFVLPHVPQMRPAWMLRAGLFLYDHLARRRRLPASRALRLRSDPLGAAVRPDITRGFAYADCRTDDARLVVANALDARRRGTRVLLRTELLAASPLPRHGATPLWRARLRAQDGSMHTVDARALVNAAGPWVGAVGRRIEGAVPARAVRLVKGSHLVVPKFWEGEHGFLLQNVDRRVVFATPYEGAYAMVGTTDIPYEGAPEDVAMSPEEAAYLCEAVNRQLRCTLTPADAAYAYSGVRCLVADEHEDPSAVTRDYALELAATAQHAPVLTVLGGKITTYRRLAEHALELLTPALGRTGAGWTATQALPGGEFDDAAIEWERLRQRYDFVPEAHLRGLFWRHGALLSVVLAQAHALAQLGRHWGGGLYDAEIDYLRREEWARDAADLLWRRTKCGLLMTPAEREQAQKAFGAPG